MWYGNHIKSMILSLLHKKQEELTLNKKIILFTALFLTVALGACSSRQPGTEPSDDPAAAAESMTVESMTTDPKAGTTASSDPKKENRPVVPVEIPSDAAEYKGRFLKSTGGDGIIVIDNYGPVVFTYASDDRSVLDTLKDGDAVSVKTGLIMETWPGQTTVYGCELLRKGKRASVDPHTLASLMEMGQIEKAPLSPMFYARDTLFIGTDRTARPACGTEDGSFSSILDNLTVPTENSQANFGKKGDGYISLADGAMAVRTGDRYTLFLADGTVEYEGRFFQESDLSKDTLEWLEFYHNLSEEYRLSVSYIPHELLSEDHTGTPKETDSPVS